MDQDKTPPAEAPQAPATEETKSETPAKDSAAGSSSFIKKYWWILVVILLLVGGGIAFALTRNSSDDVATSETQEGINDAKIRAEQKAAEKASKSSPSPKASDLGDAYSTDPVEKGKALANGTCTGTGSVPLTHAPMRPEEMSVIIPYGLMAGGHVTPIDHQYYWGKVQTGTVDMYDVLAPADGTLVGLQYRDRSQENGKIKGDYRGVIAYSCTFLTYFDLVTSMSAEIQAQLPKDWEKSGGTQNINIPVKAGQVLGKVGGQSLDFAVWDTTKQLKNLLVPTAYNNSEPWKVVTVPPLDYFTDAVKAQILPLYARTAEPRDGVIDQDIDGTLAGNWFKEGTHGYAGSERFTGGTYWTGHLSFVKDHVDPDGGYVFSTGNWNGEALQFGVINPATKPEAVTPESGLVKYQVGQWNHTRDGKTWIGEGPGTIKFSAGSAKGTILVQMLEKRKLKVEVFPGKTPAQVTGFTSAAQTYNRGDDAVKAE